MSEKFLEFFIFLNDFIMFFYDFYILFSKIFEPTKLLDKNDF